MTLPHIPDTRTILPPRGLRSCPTRGSYKDGHPNIRIAFPQRDFDILARDAFLLKLPLSTYIRRLIKRGQLRKPTP